MPCPLTGPSELTEYLPLIPNLRESLNHTRSVQINDSQGRSPWTQNIPRIQEKIGRSLPRSSLATKSVLSSSEGASIKNSTDREIDNMARPAFEASAAALFPSFAATAKASEFFQAICSLSKDGVIIPVPQGERFQGFHSNLFMVPKKFATVRPILDLKLLNTFGRVRWFQMELLRSVIACMGKGEFLASIDIQDAYLHFQFVALPFGLAIAPRVLAKIFPSTGSANFFSRNDTGLVNRSIRRRSDIATAVAYINRQGGTHSRVAMNEVGYILRWGEENRSMISAVHIQEWTIGRQISSVVKALTPGSGHSIWRFSTRSAVVGAPPDVDLMASRLNSKVPVFIARSHNPAAIGKVAFLVAVMSFRLVPELAALSCQVPFQNFHQDRESSGKKKKKEKKSKKEKRKKSKKTQSEKNGGSSASSGSDSGGDWVEAVPAQPVGDKKAWKIQKESPGRESEPEVQGRVDDLRLHVCEKATSAAALRAERQKEKTLERERDEAVEKEKLQARELNPYWKDGGSGLPPEEGDVTSAKKVQLVADGGLSWLQKSLQRMQEQSDREKRSLEDIVAERYGCVSDQMRIMRSKELAKELRDRIVARHRSGQSYRISAVLEVPKSTVSSIILKWKKCGTTRSLPRPGRPAKLSNHGRRALVREVKRTPRSLWLSSRYAVGRWEKVPQSQLSLQPSTSRAFMAE
ncbi:unnamed protein product [Ranitomeya imitator]|uniref:Sleeping Beauty transposase HTH domain-containing protein n=1 Tax=Ranitomeya imitator TaxID=111125 RepID=A0ABN9LXQ2_9NEOB|nr:unnamed protein product [Ranitomeya imitator]